MSTITVRIPDELNPLIEEFCKIEDRSKSWLVKRALEEKLEEWRNTKTNSGRASAHKLQKTSRANKKKR